MAVADYFLTPLGLVALASVVPLILLYFLRPKPARVNQLAERAERLHGRHELLRTDEECFDAFSRVWVD